MRVLLDTTYGRYAPYSGTAIYLDRLTEALLAAGEVEVLSVANPRRRPPAGGGVGSVRNLAVDARWAEVELPRLATRLRADVVHHPLPALARAPGVAQVITVHDLAFERLPGCFDRRFRLYAHHAQRRAARRADAIICVSETTAADVRSLWEVPRERIVVARHGPGQAVGGSARGKDPSYFLYVGDAEPRKNLRLLLGAYARYRERISSPAPLVLAGSAEVDMPGVRVERAPTPQRLKRLYASALALIQPSLHEGFGLTALEAMSLGVPVMAARSPGLLETCAGAALYVDPHSEEELAAQMARVTRVPELRRTLSNLGAKRALDFSWALSAQAHAVAYRLARARPAVQTPSRPPTLSDAK
ncbi:MAG: glycosyltransferase family 4 protein [Solirubrobacteraceae bacterium]